jgi:hypothetical protein
MYNLGMVKDSVRDQLVSQPTQRWVETLEACLQKNIYKIKNKTLKCCVCYSQVLDPESKLHVLCINQGTIHLNTLCL